MCIAILQTKGKRVNKDNLRQSWVKNPDGAGLAYVKRGKIVVEKELKSFPDFYRKYRIALREAEGHMLIHFRIGTSGPNDEDNCHPHIVDDNLVLIHNGIMSEITVPVHSTKSDTAIFTEDIMQPISQRHPNFFANDGIKQLMEIAVRRNKIVFLRSDGEYQIINESEGHWDLGVWFSNHSYKVPKYDGFNVGRKNGQLIQDKKSTLWENDQYSSGTANCGKRFNADLHEYERGGFIDGEFIPFVSMDDVGHETDDYCSSCGLSALEVAGVTLEQIVSTCKDCALPNLWDEDTSNIVRDTVGEVIDYNGTNVIGMGMSMNDMEDTEEAETEEIGETSRCVYCANELFEHEGKSFKDCCYDCARHYPLKYVETEA